MRGEGRPRHKNLPVFIPHLGCPNDCVFCNQRAISGRRFFDEEEALGGLRRAMADVREGETAEIAFFGGSFTGIDRGLMIRLLTAACEYLETGRATSVRCSTRPDYIDADTVRLLKEYGVGTVELGIQSTDDAVLEASGRGHSAADSRNACRTVLEAGLDCVGQMMVGLPLSTPENERKTAEDICSFGCSGARIYPTVVFRHTRLEAMAKSGEYRPIGNREAASRCADLIAIFDARGVKLLRVGLCASENLASPDEVFAGASHPAIGEMSMSEVFFRRECEAIEKAGLAGAREITFFVSPGSVSKAVGQKRDNIRRLCEKYGTSRVKILEKSDLIGYNITIA
ncbi:MAG: radical SAM protein [Clostridia bacterium]|nr:radical SAM protein [Clostridia bacterium]